MISKLGLTTFPVGPKSGGSSDTSPPLQSFAEESSPENLMRTGQSTESLDSLSDESGEVRRSSRSHNRSSSGVRPSPRQVLKKISSICNLLIFNFFLAQQFSWSKMSRFIWLRGRQWGRIDIWRRRYYCSDKWKHRGWKLDGRMLDDRSCQTWTFPSFFCPYVGPWVTINDLFLYSSFLFHTKTWWQPSLPQSFFFPFYVSWYDKLSQRVYSMQ